MAGRLFPMLVALIGAASPCVAQSPAAPIASSIIAAPPDPLGDLAARRRIEEARCRIGEDEGIVVCGRLVRGGGGYRVPYRPEPGERVRLIAGELPSAMAAMTADHCIRLCLQPITIDLLHPSTIARGIDRILGGD